MRHLGKLKDFTILEVEKLQELYKDFKISKDSRLMLPIGTFNASCRIYSYDEDCSELHFKKSGNYVSLTIETSSNKSNFILENSGFDYESKPYYSLIESGKVVKIYHNLKEIIIFLDYVYQRTFAYYMQMLIDKNTEKDRIQEYIKERDKTLEKSKEYKFYK